MHGSSLYKLIKSLAAVLGVLCLFAVAGASDVELVGVPGALGGLTAGVLLILIGIAPERIRLFGLSAFRRTFRRLCACLSPAGPSHRERRSLSRAKALKISIEPVNVESIDPRGKTKEYCEERPRSKCS
jgi:hypothetical protein